MMDTFGMLKTHIHSRSEVYWNQLVLQGDDIRTGKLAPAPDVVMVVISIRVYMGYARTESGINF